MRTSQIVFLLFILLASCTDGKNDLNVETAARSVEVYGNEIVDNLDVENPNLAIIDTYQEILLRQNDDKWGEWGGDREEIRIYLDANDESILADYTKTIIDCNDPYSTKKQPIVVAKKAIVMNALDLTLVQGCIIELTKYKLSTKEIISHSGTRNSVVSIDSTLLIDHWPSFDWPKFRKLVKSIENK